MVNTRFFDIMIKPAPSALHAALALALLASFGLSAAEASVPPLDRQIQNGVENTHLKCNNADHQLVIRPSLQFACVTDESASRLGWQKVGFTENNDMIINSTLGVKIDDETFQINYVLENGLIQKARYELDSLALEIISVKNGEVRLEIPKSFFIGINESDYLGMIVLDNYVEVQSDVKSKHDKYIVEFSFSDSDPTIEIMAMTIP